MRPLDAAGRAALHGPHSLASKASRLVAGTCPGAESIERRPARYGTRKCLGGGFSRAKPPPGPADPSQFTSFPRVLLVLLVRDSANKSSMLCNGAPSEPFSGDRYRPVRPVSGESGCWFDRRMCCRAGRGPGALGSSKRSRNPYASCFRDVEWSCCVPQPL